jgi:hypothetical protein
MERAESHQAGVLVYKGVPISEDGDQHAYAYLHITGVPRDQPSHTIRAYLGDVTASAETGSEHETFAGEATTYNSPAAPSPAAPASAGLTLPERHGSYDVMLDVSDALRRIGSATTTDVTLVLTDLGNHPLDTSNFAFSDVKITRNG